MSGTGNSDFTNVAFESEVRWVYGHSPKDNSRFNGKPTFQVDLVLRTDEQLASLEEVLTANNIALEVLNPSTGKLQPRIGTDKDGTRYLTIKRQEFNTAGKRAEIAMTDASGNALPSDLIIGNGSTAIVHFYTRPMKNGKGNTLGLTGIQLTNLVSPPAKGGFKAVKGFSINDMNALNEEGTQAVHSYSSDTK